MNNFQIPQYFDTDTLIKSPIAIATYKEPIAGTLSRGISYPITIQTTVKDEQGNPLEGVHLFSIKDKLRGSTTNAQGFVKFEGVEPDEIVTFSYVGMNKHMSAMNVTSTTVLNIGGVLDEVIVTATPKKKKSNGIWWLLAAVTLTGVAYKNHQNKVKAKKEVKVDL